MKRLLLFFLLFVVVQNTFASHFRAGEITYEYVGNAAYPYRYHITITTYTKWIDPTSIDNCELKVFFGDGDSAIAPRTNGANVFCAITKSKRKRSSLFMKFYFQ